MKLNYTTKALGLYMRQTGKNLMELAEETGIGYATLSRYAKEERLPDISMLLRICNTLHLRINNFFVHPDIELTSVRIFHPEEWSDIRFRYDRIEAVRMTKGLTKTGLVDQINQAAGTNITRLTYNLLTTGQHLSCATVLGLLEATRTDLDYIFEQDMPEPPEDSILVSRRRLAEMEQLIKQQEDTIRELELKYKRLEKRSLPRYEERMNNLDAIKIINAFAKQVERSLIELKSWVPENSFRESRKHPYDCTDIHTGMVADSGIGREDDERTDILV